MDVDKDGIYIYINNIYIYMLLAKHGFAQTRDCPAQTLDPCMVCLCNLEIALTYYRENFFGYVMFNYNESTKVVSTMPEPGRAVERTHR